MQNKYRYLVHLLFLFTAISCNQENNVYSLTRKINFADDTPLIGHLQNYKNTKYCKIESYILWEDSVGFSGELHKTELLNFKNGKIDEQLIFNSAGLLEAKQKYIYNRNENLIEIIKYDEHESPGEKVLFITDDFGNIFEEQRLIEDSAEVIEKWVYSYNPENNIIEINNVDSFMHTVIKIKRIYKYDDKFNITESAFLSRKDTVLFSQKFKYDDENLLIHKEEINSNAQVNSISDYSYDDNKRIQEVSCYTYAFDGIRDTTLSKTFYSYVDL